MSSESSKLSVHCAFFQAMLGCLISQRSDAENRVNEPLAVSLTRSGLPRIIPVRRDIVDPAGMRVQTKESVFTCNGLDSVG